MEDVDTTRCKREYGDHQIQTLRQLGFIFDEPVWQSTRDVIYQAEFDRLKRLGAIYPCTCTRRDIGDGIYQGTCRNGHAVNKPIRSWRFRVGDDVINWQDENGTQRQEQLMQSVGDFVVKRVIDEQHHEWTYQFAVVVDDALQQISHIVRGADLIDSTARQIALQRALGYPTLVYSHFPLLTNEQGEKLSKSGQAPTLDMLKGLEALQHAWVFLGGLPIQANYLEAFWAAVGVKQKT
ncbi:glutamyl-Q tRNA(Asp) synthetase [Formosimonas limnophila]|uniref:Glutamyl-Q tRNA(Asp) synthetase n=2 Tax=Formosimonas limnophila TaxID=1384487 RepID=A0A8J3CHK4_9BURK|nr:glutamyl-Q tRNA(Asp) synthetase [Formosimonas limnophila]